MSNNNARLPVALLALSGAILACGLPGRASIIEPTPDFATATPGGSISVSLLTPAGDGDPSLATLNPSDTTPIGPIATSTALARIAANATATTEALNTRRLNPPATCPDAGNPVVPSQPATFDQYPEVIAEYLTLGGPPNILEATLRSWGAITSTDGLVRSDRDFNADGVPDVLLVMIDPNSIRQPPSGDLFLFGCQDAVYRQLLRAGYSTERSAPVIVSADDLFGNGYNHLVYVVEYCIGLDCSREVNAFGWSLPLGNFVPLTDGPLTIPGIPSDELGVSVVDTGGDGIAEILLTSGSHTDPAAGPTRVTTEVWSWNSASFILTQVVTSDIVYRIHVIHDGDAALEQGDYALALEHYSQAISDSSLERWTLPNERDYMTAYAFYRRMLASVLNGNQSGAASAFADLQSRFPLTLIVTNDEGQEEEVASTEPGIIYTQMAIAFWDNYSRFGDHGTACAEAVSFAQRNSAVLSPLNSFGYANRQYVAVDMCPFITQ